ncbi:nitroreductase family protein [bacterium]|nr:nitroreductase family protein [bacterium]
MMKNSRGKRNFSDKPVPHDVLLKILEAGGAAHSGIVNGVHIYVMDDPEKRRAIHEICVETEKEWILSQPASIQDRITSAQDYDPGLKFLKKAPLFLIISTRPLDPEIPYAVESAFMTIGYMLVMAKGMGLISAPFAPSILHNKDANRLNSILKLPGGESIQALLPIGYPTSTGKVLAEHPIQNIFHNVYGDKYFTD